MEILVGRVTADAKVSTLKDERKVVNFSIAVNDSFKPKGAETKRLTRFVNCSYWISDGVAAHLTKGILVELYGRIDTRAFTNAQGETKAGLTMHVNNIKLHGKPKFQEPALNTEPDPVADNLPF